MLVWASTSLLPQAPQALLWPSPRINLALGSLSGRGDPRAGSASLSFPSPTARDRAASAPLPWGCCGLQGHLTPPKPASPPWPSLVGDAARRQLPALPLVLSRPVRLALPPGLAGASRPRHTRPMVLTSPSVRQPLRAGTSLPTLAWTLGLFCSPALVLPLSAEDLL